MKKFSFFIAAIFYCNLVSSQVVTYDFYWNGVEAPSCNPFKTNKTKINSQQDPFDGTINYWTASHGSPYLTGNQGIYDVTVLETSYNDSDKSFKSEGIFLKSHFSECYYYDITVLLRRQSGYAGLSVYAANELSEREGTSCTQESVPSVLDSDRSLIVANSNVPQPDRGAYTGLSKIDFLANNNYNYLWLYTTSDEYKDHETGSIKIIEVLINNKGHETEAPTVPTNLTISNESSTGFTLNWTKSTDNVRVAGYQIYINGIAKATTTGTSYTFNNLNTNHVYSVKVRAYDPVDNYSAFSAEKSIYITPDLDITGSLTELCNNSSRSFSTTIYSNASYTWSTNAGLSLNNTTSNSVTATASTSYSGTALITVKRTMVKNGVSNTKSASASIWIGVPPTPSKIEGFFSNGQTFAGDESYLFSVNCNWSCDWIVNKGIIESGQGTNMITATTYPAPQTGKISFVVSVRSKNTCGLSTYLRRTGYIMGQDGPIFSNKNLSLTNNLVYPNPFNTSFSVSLQETLNEEETIEKIIIYDFSGRIVYKNTYPKGTIKTDVNLSSLNNASYIVQITKHDGTVESSIIVKQ